MSVRPLLGGNLPDRILGGRSLVLPFVGAANARRRRRGKRKGGGPNLCERRFPDEVRIAFDCRRRKTALRDKGSVRPTLQLVLGPVFAGQQFTLRPEEHSLLAPVGL